MNWTRKDKTLWHHWFAWYPVAIEDRWIWLEAVDRRYSETFCGGRMVYRLATTSVHADAH